MTGISSSVGLISGIDYTSLVDQLIAIDSIPKDRLQSQTDLLTTQKQLLDDLNLLLMTGTYTINNLNRKEPFERCDPSSSNEAVLSVSKTANGTPTPGSYTFTPLQTAQAQQTIAAGVASDTEALGKTGTITIGSGWSLEKNVSLSDINGGAGFTKGYIRVTDGTGTRATIDLRNATTISDVVDAINNSHTIDVFAEIVEDRLVLSDMSGVDAADSKFAVADVTGGSTASSLGLAGKTADDGYIIGDSIYRLGEDMSLGLLNDGLGIVTDNLIGDLQVTCRDGSTVTIDFNKRSTTTEIENGARENYKELTLGDLIDTINNSTDGNGVAGKVKASISEDGKRLVLTDTTSKMIANPDYDEDAGESEENPTQIADPTAKTVITQVSTSPILQSLGFVGDTTDTIESTDGTFTTRYLIGGLNSPLMSSMNGGYGLSAASAGEIEVQDRAGNKATISFTQEELDLMQTFEDAVYVLNYKFATAELDSSTEEDPRFGIGLEVKMNDAKNGFQIVDTTGQTAENIIFRDKVTEHTETVENEDGEEETVTTTTQPNIASTLGLEIDAARSSVSGSSLDMQVYSHATKLSDLNGGKGITLAGAKITITDSAGRTSNISFDSKTHSTLGDVINSINRDSSIGVFARINDSGDGILLEDRAGGNGSLSVFDADSTSKIASELKIAQVAPQDSKVDGKLVIDGSQSYKIEVEETDSLDDIRKKINDLGGNFTATVVADGSDTPYRLAISSNSTGAAGAMNIDLSCLGLKTETMTEARDAILVFGDASTDAGVSLYSSSNTFKNVVNGLDLTIGTVPETPTPVTITCEKNSIDIKVSLETFVTNYNNFKQKLNEYTFFEVTDDGVSGNYLYNNTVARNMDREIINIIQKQVYGITGINSLQSLGVSIRSSLGDEETLTTTGNLVFDGDVFDAAYAANPDGVREFFYQSHMETDENGKEIEVKTGWAQTFMTAAEKVTGDTTGNQLGKVYYEMETIQNKIDQNTSRIEFMQGRLDVKKQQMLNKFYAMEQALASMSADMTTVSNIASSWSSNYSASGGTGY